MQPDQDQRIATIEDELRALPQVSPPPELWRRIEGQLADAERLDRRAQRNERPPRTLAMRHAMAAAVCLMALAALTLYLYQSGLGIEQRGAAIAQSPVGNERALQREAMHGGEFMPTTNTLRIGGVPQGFAPRVVALRIADLDARLETLALRDGVEQRRLERLQSQRDQLMDSLYHIEQSERAVRILRVAH